MQTSSKEKGLRAKGHEISAGFRNDETSYWAVNPMQFMSRKELDQPPHSQTSGLTVWVLTDC